MKAKSKADRLSVRLVHMEILLALALLSAMTGCGKEKDADPLTVTLWHVYGGEVDSPAADGDDHSIHPGAMQPLQPH